jgi:2-dehydropantoate 2-reductase
MRFAIVGAGGIGGYLGARLALAGEEVTFVARGANLEAIRRDGIKVIEADGSERVVRDVAAVPLAEGRPCDVVLLAVKAHQLADIAPGLGRLLAPGAPVVTLQNGIPWWYFYRAGGEHDGRPVRAVDPTGIVAASIDSARVIGCIVFLAAELVAPGVVRVFEGNRLTLGEPDGSASDRAARVSEAFSRAGFKAPVVTDIRSEIWLKLWGNVTFNPISALTHATMGEMCRFPLTRSLIAAMMAEARAVGEALGAHIRVPIERRIAGAERAGDHKTSMLQDVEAGRALELDALVGAVVELGQLAGVATPHIDAVHACTSLLAFTLHQHGARLSVARRVE